jgi:hypothetical protein
LPSAEPIGTQFVSVVPGNPPLGRGHQTGSRGPQNAPGVVRRSGHRPANQP